MKHPDKVIRDMAIDGLAIHNKKLKKQQESFVRDTERLAKLEQSVNERLSYINFLKKQIEECENALQYKSPNSRVESIVFSTKEEDSI